MHSLHVQVFVTLYFWPVAGCTTVTLPLLKCRAVPGHIYLRKTWSDWTVDSSESLAVAVWADGCGGSHISCSTDSCALYQEPSHHKIHILVKLHYFQRILGIMFTWVKSYKCTLSLFSPVIFNHHGGGDGGSGPSWREGDWPRGGEDGPAVPLWSSRWWGGQVISAFLLISAAL